MYRRNITMTPNEFKVLRNAVIEKEFSRMNDMQFKAVTAASGPVLVLAGAGSGKTTVLVNRIAYLIKYGDAYDSYFVPELDEYDIIMAENFLKNGGEMPACRTFSYKPAKPWEILAITFTNKAANELKERIALKLADDSSGVWAGTFHSVCGKILRRYGDRIGYSSNFTIYDTDDQKRLIKEIIRENGFDEKIFQPKGVLSVISAQKEQLISPEDYAASVGDDYRQKTIAKIYGIYENRLATADAMDFDGMISNTVRLFKENEDVLEYYSKKFRYIMVDEYQDTNHSQYMLCKMLASGYENICVVGDDDQSIYRFRGATIENILSFERQYKNARVIKLEQNYRSYGNILSAANAVIANNKGRTGKSLWTDKGDGDKIKIYTAPDEQSEARHIADTILENVRNGAKFSDHAILYRMNAQSNSVENVFARSGISYRVIGGHRFFDRKEIRDVMAYLHLIVNNNDDIRLRRIINEPKRGIGDTTVNNAAQIASSLGVSVFEVLHNADHYPMLSRAANKLRDFCEMIDDLTEAAENMSIHDTFELMLQKTGYADALMLEGPEGQERLENVRELSSSIMQYESENEGATLTGYLEEMALISDIDSYEEGADAVVMMTVHSAKGLEFDRVFLVGMEEGIFPSQQSVYGGPIELEEERRLAYVAITRARKQLHITHSDTRMLYGSTSRNPVSRFVNEIPEVYCDISSGRRFFQGQSANAIPKQVRPSGYDYSNVFKAPTTAKPAQSGAVYKIGMTVEHKTFGRGLVTAVTPMANDTMLEIAFDSVGTKKLMAGFAKLKIN